MNKMGIMARREWKGGWWGVGWWRRRRIR